MRVNEIFYSLQGEGYHTGTPAIFIRLAGCNLKCDFCDTNFQSYKEYSEDEIMAQIQDFPANHVVITGGEPTLQLTQSFIDKLHAAGKYVQIETNGSVPMDAKLTCSIDWITCSPKDRELKIQDIDELKVVYEGQDMSKYDDIIGNYLIKRCYLQACDRKNEALNKTNLSATIEYIKSHPIWKLSLQTQKILDVR